MPTIPGAPTIIDPINTWFDTITVEGCLADAIVSIIAINPDGTRQEIIKSKAKGGRDTLPLLAGFQFVAGQKLISYQTIGNTRGMDLPEILAVTVDEAPTDYMQLAPLSIKSRPFECGKACWVTQAAPGALVHVYYQNSIFGQGRADSNGDARIVLNFRFPSKGNEITLKQSAPPNRNPLLGVASLTTFTTLPLPLEAHLPQLAVSNPPQGCDNAILVENAIDGALVTIEFANSGLVDTALFDLDTLWFTLQKPINKNGDHISLYQSLDQKCEKRNSIPLEMNALPAKTPPLPNVVPPCQGMSLLHIENLKGGAMLTVEATGQNTYIWTIPFDAQSFNAPILALPFPASIKVTQSLCNLEASIVVEVVEGPAEDEVSLIGPLYDCATAVSVKATPNTFIEILEDTGNGFHNISGPLIWINSPYTKISVSSLTENAHVEVHQIACGGVEKFSKSIEVKEKPKLVQLETPVLIEGASFIPAVDAIEGAEVTAWKVDKKGSNKQKIGYSVIVASDKNVYLNRRLTTDDYVWLTQKMCNEVSRDVNPSPVYPNTKTFQLIHNQLTQHQGVNYSGSPENPSHPLIINSFQVICKFSGDWLFTVDADNTEPNADVDFSPQFQMQLPPPPFQPFGCDIDLCMLSGSNLQNGYSAVYGIQSSRTFNQPGWYKNFTDPEYWLKVLDAPVNQKFLLLDVAWHDYKPLPDSNGPPDDDN